MSADIYFVSCYQDSAPVRTDLLTDNPGPVYWFGDLVYMDATVGTASGQWKAGMVGGAAHWPENGAGFTCTVGGAPAMANGLAGQLPVVTWTVVTPGNGYPESLSLSFGGGLAVELTPALGGPGSGATGLAVTHMTPTAAITNGATSATLTQAPKAGDGVRTCTFSNGQTRSCTFSGTNVTFAAMTGGNATKLSDGLGQIQSITPHTGGSGYATGAGDTFKFSRHNGTRDNWKARVNQVMSFKPFVDYLAKRKALGLKWYFMPDDHEYFNNWCHAVSNAANGVTTQAQNLDFWREASAAWQSIVPTWFDNVSYPNVPGGDIPSAMVGVTGRLGPVSYADYPKWDFVHDYAADGTLISAGHLSGSNDPSRALAFKVIGIDCITAKSAIAQADGPAKYMIGPLHEQRVYDAVADAVARRAKHILLMTGKDFYNLDNTDGWGVPTDGSTHFPYIVQRDRLLQTIHNMLVGTGTGIIYISGDRHCPHVAMRSLDLGDSYNAFVICGTPWGSNSMGLTTTGYNELLHWNPDVDPVVHTAITYDEDAQRTTVRVVDNITGRDRSRFDFPWGSSLPLNSGMRTRRKLADFKTVAGIT